LLGAGQSLHYHPCYPPPPPPPPTTIAAAVAVWSTLILIYHVTCDYQMGLPEAVRNPTYFHEFMEVFLSMYVKTVVEPPELATEDEV
jgi:hypothetical protein